jgi:hypothetical protein
MREALKGFRAIENGWLNPMVAALSLINTTVLAYGLPTETLQDFKKASFKVLRELERLIYEAPNEVIFKTELARFTSLIKATRRFQAYLSAVNVSVDAARSIFWLSNSRGEEVMISDCVDQPGPHRAFECVPRSPIARCASELWEREQASSGGQFTSLYYELTRKELRQEFCVDEPTITKWCRAEGFGWLPRASRTPVPKASNSLQKVA